MTKAKKIQSANKAVTALSAFSSIVICKRGAISADEMQSFRRYMHETAEARVRIVKNRPFIKSAENSGSGILEILNDLHGNTIILAGSDVAKVASALYKSEQKEKFTYVSGLVDNKKCAQSSFELFSQFTSKATVAFAPAILLLSSVLSIVNILQKKAEGNIDMNSIKEKIDTVLSAHQGSEETKKIVRTLLELPIMDAAYVVEMLKEILGDQMPTMSSASASDSKAVQEEDPDMPVVLEIESIEGMNKLPAVKALRANIKKDGADLSAADALGILKVGVALPTMPKSKADLLIAELASHNVIAKKKS